MLNVVMLNVVLPLFRQKIDLWRFARDKHASLFNSAVNDPDAKFYEADTRSKFRPVAAAKKVES